MGVVGAARDARRRDPVAVHVEERDRSPLDDRLVQARLEGLVPRGRLAEVQHRDGLAGVDLEAVPGRGAPGRVAEAAPVDLAVDPRAPVDLRPGWRRRRRRRFDRVGRFEAQAKQGRVDRGPARSIAGCAAQSEIGAVELGLAPVQGNRYGVPAGAGDLARGEQCPRPLPDLDREVVPVGAVEPRPGARDLRPRDGSRREPDPQRPAAAQHVVPRGWGLRRGDVVVQRVPGAARADHGPAAEADVGIGPQVGGGCFCGCAHGADQRRQHAARGNDGVDAPSRLATKHKTSLAGSKSTPRRRSSVPRWLGFPVIRFLINRTGSAKETPCERLRRRFGRLGLSAQE